MQGNATGWNKKVTSPPKQQGQPPKVRCYNCNASHGMDKCNDLMSMPLEKVVEKLKAERSCYNCLKPNHIAKFCRDEGFKCNKCGLMHPTILCGLRQLQQQQRIEKAEELKKAQGAQGALGTQGAQGGASGSKNGGDRRNDAKGKGTASGNGNGADAVNLNNA